MILDASEEKGIILVVDDIELNRAIIAEVFKNEYYILEAENGAEAVKLIEEYLPSVVIVLLDIIMPVMDGFEVMNFMNNRGWLSRLPVVMITSDTSEESTQKGYEMGVSDIISKPFNPKLVRQRINNIIELYSHKNNLENLIKQQMNVLRERSEKLHQSSVNMIDTLSNVIKYRTLDYEPHVINIRIVTKAILKELVRLHPEYSLTSNQINHISEGSALHDIGKISIPDAVLNKPGRLNEKELLEARKHTTRGGDLIKQIINMKKRDYDYFKYCYEICHFHHERWDGKGYPEGVSGNEIPVWAQVVSIADVYEALVSHRAYRDAYPHSQAVAMIKNGECGSFNPDILEAFLAAEKNFSSEFPELKKNEISESASFNNGEEKPGVEKTYNSDRVLWLLEMERQKYQILSEMSGDILFDYNTQNNKVTFSETFTKLTGLKIIDENADTVIFNTPIIFDEDRETLYNLFMSLSPEKLSFRTEIRIKLQNGTYRWYEIFGHSIWDVDNGEAIGSIIGKLVNIDRQKRETEQWRKAADTDALTNVLNKAATESHITELIESAGSAESALCFIDLDNFKGINDTYGHVFGDEVLIKVADELFKSVRVTDIVGRVGGDEFVVFLRGIGSIANIESKVSQITETLRMDYGDCIISASIGVARYPHDAHDYKTLLDKADKALYFVKSDGKDGYVFYNSKFDDDNFTSQAINT